jgi:haloacid dehalogenase-like hydrolase
MIARAPVAAGRLAEESSFYLSYRWGLNPFPPLGDVVGRLRGELRRVGDVATSWHRDEATTNVFLMACAIADTIDDYLLGVRWDLSRATKILPILGPVAQGVDGLLALSQAARAWRRRALVRWRADWGSALEEFLIRAVVSERAERGAVARARRRLESLLIAKFPDDLRARRPRIPGPFRRHDLTHHDVVALGRKFAAAFPERRRPLLVLGLRTAGSYFGPMLAACLKADGYEDVASVTIHPKKGVAPWEAARLARGATRGRLVLLIDEPLDTGLTLARAIAILRHAGIDVGNVIALLPVHPTRREWTDELERLAISDVRVLRLEPEEWHKRRLLAPDAVEPRLRQYFEQQGYVGATLVESAAADEFNLQLERRAEATFRSRLKRVFAVRLWDTSGRSETRYVLAKSVGWGWLGYHAFIAAEELSGFVPPVLGLRDGILYMEWLRPPGPHALGQDRAGAVRTVASYVGLRARALRLESDPSLDLSRRRYHEGIEMLAAALSRAYGSRAAAALKGARIGHELSRQGCPVPTLIDGRMHLEEWITGAGMLLKTDFEHHGLGKSELNVTDPAYDLAAATLAFHLSSDEERALVEQYVKDSGDREVEERLFLHKLLAGIAATSAALGGLADPRLAGRHREFNRRYVEAWHFLTIQTARFCGRLCLRPDPIGWRSPLIVLDIDGVVDRRLFGFPSTTAAGIRALSLLHAHGVGIAVNTARAIGEVKAYCEAYGCAGGVAEYGSAAWDAVGGRERVLVSAAARGELERVRSALRELPGVFLDDEYRYSIRAYTYERNATAPVPTVLVKTLLSRLATKTLAVRPTTIDTAIHASDVDKGRGLRGLLDLVGPLGLDDVVAVGDSEPDLAMFEVAGRSFAPASIVCRPAARKLGCRIVAAAHQRGLLRAARLLLHPDGRRCERCRVAERARPRTAHLFVRLLEVADRSKASALLRALVDPMALRAFVRPE